MQKLTNYEFIALNACLNYDDREAQLSDNFSNGGTKEIAKACGISQRAAGGVMSSLIQKGLAIYDDNEGHGDILWLTEDGVNLIFDIFDEASSMSFEEQAEMF